MRLLLDTHIALWAITDDRKLKPRARELIADSANDKLLSVVSLIEIAIKYATVRNGTRQLPVSAAEADEAFQEAGYAPLPLRNEHVFALEQTPVLHGDPFDRLLAAQALTENLRLLTHDARLAAYDSSFLLV